MCYGEWAVIRNLGGSRSCCVLGRDCTEVRRYKKLLRSTCNGIERSFIIHLTVVETSSFSVDFYRKIFREIL